MEGAGRTFIAPHGTKPAQGSETRLVLKGTIILDRSPQNTEQNVEQSLALLETIFADGPMGFAFLDREFRYVRINERMAEINELPVEAHLGHTLEEVFGVEKWLTRRPLFEQALGGEAVIDRKMPGLVGLPGGGMRHVMFSYLPVWVSEEVVGIAVMLRDITAQAQAEEALRQSEARKAAIIEHALDCIIKMDENGRIVEFNPAAEKAFGYARAEVLGQRMAELIIPPALRPGHYAGFAHYLQTGEGPILRKRIEIMAMRRGGEEFPVELAVVPSGQNGRPLLIAYLRDISDRRRDDSERTRLLQEVEAASERQGTFLRDVLASVTEGRLRLCYTPDDLPAPLPPVTEPIFLSLSSGIRDLRHQAEAAALARGFHKDRWYDLVTAASEAAMNAVVHAGGGEGRIHADGSDTVQVWVRDHGKGIDVAHLPRATLEKGYTTAGTLGHGMKMMLQTADRIFLLTGATGTTVVLEQDRVAPAPLNW